MAACSRGHSLGLEHRAAALRSPRPSPSAAMCHRHPVASAPRDAVATQLTAIPGLPDGPLAPASAASDTVTPPRPPRPRPKPYSVSPPHATWVTTGHCRVRPSTGRPRALRRPSCSHPWRPRCRHVLATVADRAYAG